MDAPPTPALPGPTTRLASTRRLIGLDLLRLLAVALVLGRHMWTPPARWPFLVKRFAEAWQRGGWVGVDLFFVLSGFLISGLLFSEHKSRGRISAARFYVRRGWKIYPPFFVMLSITALVPALFHHPAPWRRFVPEVFFVQNYLPGIWNHTWSLAVEEHFYLLLPLLLLVLARFGSDDAPFRLILPLGAIVAVAGLALRIGNSAWHPRYSHLTHLYPTHLRLDSLSFGVVISYVFHYHREGFVRALAGRRLLLLITGILLLAPAFILPLETTPFVYTFGLTLFYLGSGMLLIAVQLTEIPRNRMTSTLAFFGARSYSIYLWHMPVLLWFLPLVQAIRRERFGYTSSVAWYFVASLAIGVLMSEVIEIPALRVRDRWFGYARGRQVRPAIGESPEPGSAAGSA